MYEKLLIYTLYSHNLSEPGRSFATDITLKDFDRGVYHRDLKEAKKVVYVNPRGQSIILKDKNGVKQ